MSLKKYKIIDIAILTVCAIISDLVGRFIGNFLGDAMNNIIFIAPSMTLIIIIYLRWGLIGIIPNLITGVVQLLLYQEQLLTNINLWLPYLLGYLSIFSINAWKLTKNDFIKTSKLRMFLFYYLITFFVMIGTESLFGVLLGTQITPMAYLSRHVGNFLLTFIVMVIAVNQKNLMVDMKTYILKLQAEMKEEEK